MLSTINTINRLTTSSLMSSLPATCFATTKFKRFVCTVYAKTELNFE